MNALIYEAAIALLGACILSSLVGKAEEEIRKIHWMRIIVIFIALFLLIHLFYPDFVPSIVSFLSGL